MPGNIDVTIPLSPRDAGTGNKLAVTSDSGATAAINASFVDVVVDALTFVKIGTAPTAVADTSYAIPANVPVRFPIKPGDKIAAVTATTGNLYYHPVGRLSKS